MGKVEYMGGVFARLAAAFGVMLIALAGIGGLAWVFQDAIALALINPNRSYEAYTPPPAPDYGDADAWLSRGGGEALADVFYVHSNVYRGDGRWNAPYDRETQLPFIRNVLLQTEAGPFADYASVWAPRYRQPTFYARFTQKRPGAAARDTAYRDVVRAFETFLAERDPEKPFLVVGYGDGALFAGRLFIEKIAENPALRRQLAALYAIGMPLPARMFDGETCSAEDEPRCVIAFTPVDRRFTYYQEELRERTLTLAPNRGYVSTSMTGMLCNPPPLPSRMGAAQIGETERFVRVDIDPDCQDGLLIFEPPADPGLRQRRFFGQQWYPNDVNLFYEALSQDAGRRLTGLLRDLAKEENTVPPMMPAEDIEDAPINKIPDIQ